MTTETERVVTSETPLPVWERGDGLVRVDARWSLQQVARYCRDHNWIFPVARPLPALSLAQFCVRFPFFADAFVAGASGVVAGAPVTTPNAPRAAMGPDLLGGLMTGRPLFEPHSLQIRVFEAARTSLRRERFSSVHAAAMRVVDEINEGRTFCLEAFAGNEGVVILFLEAARPEQEPLRVPSQWAWSPGARAYRGISLCPGDMAAVAACLNKRERIVAAPFMGRVGSLSAQRGSRWGAEVLGDESLHAACADLAQRLVVAQRNRESPGGK